MAAIVATACLAIPASASATQPHTASKQTQSAGPLAHERYHSFYGEPDTVRLTRLGERAIINLDARADRRVGA